MEERARAERGIINARGIIGIGGGPWKLCVGIPMGPLMGGPQCRLSILRNGNVPCHYFRNFPVNFKIFQRRLSILRNGNVPCH